ncbi:DUF4270 domain-containing protein [Flavobacterium sp. MAH-1]|uniref:DUF4270 domain-containing protein n=1 Tax=Flavobacterium agri TaxID=2743471 RepID=A0A7Y9C4X3_9FLAO|nr:DUF4270 domain-containing protein [Flavobacterium agri]NUY80325.1 DUF4270 domain-containing protein [Flavobacterium agri]NYA70350.1 DUF4270 domain-containing protein [Flavobacterium agri]
MSSKFLKTVLFFATALTLVSCDKDYNEIGTDIIGDDHYDFLKKDDYSISAASYATGPVQTNGLSLVPFGIYEDDHFGRTTANFVTQVELAAVNPTLDDLIDIDSVRLYVPYFSKLEETESDGDKIYSLDSIFGNRNTTLDLKIYENKYFLRSQEVVGNEPEDQIYYNDMSPVIESANAGSAQVNNSTDPTDNTAFFFKNTEIKQNKYNTNVTEEDHTVIRQTPGMYMTLDKAFFKTKILEAPEGMLTNNNVFKNYFRGLYFKVSNPSTAKGVLNMMNFSKGVVTLYYRRNITTTANGTSTTVARRFELKLNLTGNSVSLLNYENTPALPSNRLVVKGGQGFLSTIDILTAEERAQMVHDSLKVNEASLVFHVDEAAMQGATKPRRIYLYDMTHGQSTVDYNFDGSTNGDTKYSKSVFGGILDSAKIAGTNQYKFFYKVRLTNYIRGLINEPDSTDVRLGLSVSENILENSMARLKNPISIVEPDNSTSTYNKLPRASVMHPFGVVLHGVNSEVVEERLKLVIYYTKPDEVDGN